MINVVFGSHVDALIGGYRHCLFVFEKFLIDVVSMCHGIPTAVENIPDKVLAFRQNQRLKIVELFFLQGMLEDLEYLHKKEK